jgi:hypothetical protein
MDFNRKVDSNSYTALDMPLYPARVLTAHCAVKGLQAGSLVGLFVVTPFQHLVRKAPLTQAWRSAMPSSAIAGTAMSLGFLTFKGYQGALDIAGVDDRAYRISQNQGQVKVDRYSMIGGLTGASIGAVVSRFGLRSVLASGCTGVAVAVIYYVVEKSGGLDEVKNAFNSDRKPHSN